MSDPVNVRRRRILGTTLASFSLADLGLSSLAHAQSSNETAGNSRTGSGASFGPIKQIDAGVLNAGYAEAGPKNGTPVLLLHGWPYDIHSYVEVAPMLAAAG